MENRISSLWWRCVEGAAQYSEKSSMIIGKMKRVCSNWAAFDATKSSPSKRQRTMRHYCRWYS